MVGAQRTTYFAARIVAVLGLTVVAAACGSSSSSSSNASSSAASTSPTSSGASGAAAVGTAKNSLGTYLTGQSGRSLYIWLADSGGKSACSGACASSWPPLTTKSAPTASGGAMAADLGMITRSDGTKQVTYKGHPLYYYAGDTAAGMTNGNGSNQFGAKWWLISPSGSQVGSAAKSSSSASSNGSSTSSSGSSSGGGWG